MKFSLDDFLQLDTNGLLAVNGGSGCSSGPSSGSSDSSGGSSSSGNSFGASSRPVSSTTETIYVPTGPYNGYLVTRTKKGSNKVTSSGGVSSSGGGSCSSSYEGVGSTSYQTGGSSSSGSHGCSGGGSSAPSGGNNGGGTCSNISQKNERLSIQEAVTKHLDEKYIIGVNDCDIWVAKVLNDAGIDMEKIWGSTNLTVDQHENIMEYVLSNNPNLGWNVVLMTDSDNGAMSHTGLIRIASDGSVNYYDCSKNNSNKGSKWSWFSSIEAFENNYGSGDSACYKDFDYYGL